MSKAATLLVKMIGRIDDLQVDGDEWEPMEHGAIVVFPTPDDARKLGRFLWTEGRVYAAEDVEPLLQRLANEAWMRLDYETNAEICALLGEKSALEHEGGGDKP